MSDKQLILNTVQKVDETTSYEEIYSLYTIRSTKRNQRYGSWKYKNK